MGIVTRPDPYGCADCGWPDSFHTGQRLRLYGGQVTLRLDHDYQRPQTAVVIQRMRDGFAADKASAAARERSQRSGRYPTRPDQSR